MHSAILAREHIENLYLVSSLGLSMKGNAEYFGMMSSNEAAHMFAVAMRAIIPGSVSKLSPTYCLSAFNCFTASFASASLALRLWSDEPSGIPAKVTARDKVSDAESHIAPIKGEEEVYDVALQPSSRSSA